MNIRSVGIIGCGWLGSALANHLKAQGVTVLATRSNAENIEQLNSQGINAEILALPADQTELNSHAIFKQQCLVIAITPQFKQGRVDYANKIQQLVVAATANSHVEKIILLSSTAVYNGLSGWVEEDNILNMMADKVDILNQAEQRVLGFNSKVINTSALSDASAKKKAYVLRLSGLVGPKRHPGNFLLSGRMLQHPQAFVNLIHQKDAIGLVDALLKSEIFGGIFNGVSATQITKKQYYQAAAKALKLPEPTFQESKLEENIASKRVSRIKTQSTLGYSFVYDDLLVWLEQAS